MSQVGLQIIATECRDACAGEPDLEKRIRKAMAPVANGHWMFSDDDLCFRGALGGVLLSPDTSEEDKARVTASVKALQTLSAMMSGLPIDAEQLAKQMADGPETLPLMAMWREAKKAKP